MQEGAGNSPAVFGRRTKHFALRQRRCLVWHGRTLAGRRKTGSCGRADRALRFFESLIVPPYPSRRNDEEDPVVAANVCADIERAAGVYDPFVTNKRPQANYVTV
jgi:hypothetical protein